MGSRWGGTEAASVVQATRAAPSGRRMLRGQRFQVTVFQIAALPLTLCDFERVFISLRVSTSGKLGPPPHPQCGERFEGKIMLLPCVLVQVQRPLPSPPRKATQSASLGSFLGKKKGKTVSTCL